MISFAGFERLVIPGLGVISIGWSSTLLIEHFCKTLANTNNSSNFAKYSPTHCRRPKLKDKMRPHFSLSNLLPLLKSRSGENFSGFSYWVSSLSIE